jgi:hypothetical protein
VLLFSLCPVKRPQGFPRVILHDSTYANLGSELEKRILETPGVCDEVCPAGDLDKILLPAISFFDG